MLAFHPTSTYNFILIRNCNCIFSSLSLSHARFPCELFTFSVFALSLSPSRFIIQYSIAQCRMKGKFCSLPLLRYFMLLFAYKDKIITASSSFHANLLIQLYSFSLSLTLLRNDFSMQHLLRYCVSLYAKIPRRENFTFHFAFSLLL